MDNNQQNNSPNLGSQPQISPGPQPVQQPVVSLWQEQTNPSPQPQQPTPSMNQQNLTPDQSPQTLDTPESPPAPAHIVTAGGSTSDNLQAVSDQPAPPKKSKKKAIIISLIVLIFVLLSGGVATLAYFIAYDKIDLPFVSQENKDSLSYFVQSLSFTPKTPKYLVARTVKAHESIKTHKFDVSVAADLGNFESTLKLMGLGGLDLSAKGVVDYTNPDVINSDFTINLGGELVVDMITKDQILYFRLVKLPALLPSFIGLDDSTIDSALEKWVKIDKTPKDTTARNYAEENKEDEDPITKHILDVSQTILSDESLKDNITMTDDELDGKKTYRLKLTANEDEINLIANYIAEEFNGKKPKKQTASETTSNIVYEMWIDKNDFYTRKIVISFDIDLDTPSTLSLISPAAPTALSTTTVTIATVLDGFGEPTNINPPKDTLTPEEFYELLLSDSNVYSGIETSRNNSLDAQRMVELEKLRTSLELYKADCSTYPDTLNQLADGCVLNGTQQGAYLVEVPLDPETQDSYYYSKSNNGKTYYLCASLSQSRESDTQCPDSTYNYAVTNPGN